MALLKPRPLIAYCTVSIRATWRFGASRKASVRVVAPLRRMASEVSTKIDAAASESGSLRLETEVTRRSSSSSTDRFFSALVD